MPSVDELLRDAFSAADDAWGLRAPAALQEVRARHRRAQVVRRRVALAAAAAVVVGAVAVATSDSREGAIEPATPTPSPSGAALREGATPLEGTWTSQLLARADVEAAAALAGAPEAAPRMLAALPEAAFRVVVVVRGGTLRTLIRTAEGDELTDEESVAVTDHVVRLRPFYADGRNVHRWVLKGDELTLTFDSTTEATEDGVPAEAWQRLLYDLPVFTR